MLHAHPPSACRTRSDVTEGGNSHAKHPQDVRDYRKPGLVPRSRPKPFKGGWKTRKAASRYVALSRISLRGQAFLKSRPAFGAARDHSLYLLRPPAFAAAWRAYPQSWRATSIDSGREQNSQFWCGSNSRRVRAIGPRQGSADQ